MDSKSAAMPMSEVLSRTEAYDYVKSLDSEPAPEVTRKLFYALDLKGACSWRAVLDYVRNSERPEDDE